MKLLFFLVSFSHILFGCRAQDFPLIVPAVQSVTLADGDPFELLRSLDIVIDPRSAEVRDTDGLTLVPPSTGDFAQTFADDLHALFPSTSVSLYVGSSAPQGGIFVATGGCNFTLADGTLTSEGYSLNISSNGVIIVGSGARGVFWASRTLLQGLLLNNGSLPASLVRDGPSWETRGFMLDAGRQWYPIKFLTEICAYASWFKASEFHVHLSDNVNPGNDPNATYARFRLRPTDPSLQGLTPHINETYSMEEFEDFQNACAVRGVTVIPEIESPGHALVITQWKPELALLTDATLINLTVPESIPTIKSIWQEFLPIIHTKQVSIGADEYDSDLADNYNDFVNEMSTFMAEFNKTIRIWGTNEPSNKTSVSRDITIQHWEFFEDDPFSLIERGYSVINSDDAFMYIVMKFSGSYPQALNQTRIWDGANIRNGGAWDPHIFDRGNASNNPMVSDSLLQGAISATWNDHGPTASTYLEAFYAMKYGIPAVMANAWSPGKLNQRQFNNSIAELVASAPGQNLARHIAHHGHVVVDYTLSAGSNTVQDASGNGFDADVQENHIKTPLGSFGPPYTFRILASNTSDSASRTLLTGPDDTFLIDSSTLAFVSSNITYLLPNFTLTTSWKEIVIGATEIGTHAFVDGSVAGEFRVVIDGTAVTVPLTFVAPLAMIDAAIERFTLWDEMVDIADIHKLA